MTYRTRKLMIGAVVSAVVAALAYLTNGSGKPQITVTFLRYDERAGVAVLEITNVSRWAIRYVGQRGYLMTRYSANPGHIGYLEMGGARVFEGYGVYHLMPEIGVKTDPYAAVSLVKIRYWRQRSPLYVRLSGLLKKVSLAREEQTFEAFVELPPRIPKPWMSDAEQVISQFRLP